MAGGAGGNRTSAGCITKPVQRNELRSLLSKVMSATDGAFRKPKTLDASPPMRTANRSLSPA
jgi:hypothetical protein